MRDVRTLKTREAEGGGRTGSENAPQAGVGLL